MEKVLEKNKCTGCTACMNICPVGAISMVEDEEGFKHPKIDQNKCINCGACQKTCPVINKKNNPAINECYACYTRSQESLMNSSSGGIFKEIASHVLEEGGYVIGAAFDEENKLRHIAISNVDDLKKLQGSKYLQSDLGNIFRFVRENILQQKILFVGTPCQVAGLKAYLHKEFDNLICLDIICHGVPSPLLFKKYIEELEKKESEKLVEYNFRDKSSGWDTYSNTAIYKNKMKTELASENDYMKLFLSDNALRESCYNCNFKLGHKYSDITLGDFWGIKERNAKMYNEKGVSSLIINTEKGKKIFESIKDNLVYEKCDLKDILKGNKSLESSSKRHSKRDSFFKDMKEKTIHNLTKKYCNETLSNRILIKIKNLVKKMIK